MNGGSSQGYSPVRTPSNLHQQQQPQQQPLKDPHLLLAASQQPRRGSLPTSRRQLRQEKLQAQQLRRPQLTGSTEIFVPSSHSRLQDTPLHLRLFLNSIRPEESSEDDLASPTSPRRRKRSSSLKIRSSTRRSSLTKMASDHELEDAEETRRRVVQLSEAEKKALKASTQFTELEMVQLWNQYKFNFPTGKANRKQLKQLFRQVFPKCTKPDFIVENIMKVFDADNTGNISFRELLIAFSMSMKGTPREKLHWAFRLYDKDGDEIIEEEEMEDVFVRLCKIAKNIENAEKNAKNPPKPPPTPPVEEVPEEKTKKPDRFKKAGTVGTMGPKKKSLLTQDVQIKTMSTKLTGRSITKQPKRQLTKAEKAAKERAKMEADMEAAEAAEKAAKFDLAGNNGEEAASNDPDEPDPFDPRESARDIFFSLDVNRDGKLSEDEFVEGCMSDPSFLMMLETFSCDFLWGDFKK